MAKQIKTPQCENGQYAQEIKRVTVIGLAVNIGLSGLKFFVGFLGGSQAVIADAVHSLTDLVTDCAVLWGVRAWSSPADEDHPYGHSRIETLVTAFIGVVLALVAIGIGYKALSTVRNVDIRQPEWIALIGPLCTIVLKEIMYQWTVIVGTRVKSSAVVANAWHHRSDSFSSMPVLGAVGSAVVNPRWAFIDHVGAVIVAVFILKVAWNIITPAFSELADRGASAKVLERIRSVALSVEGVESIHGLRTRHHGNGLYIDLHILVNGEMTVREGHAISRKVKHQLVKAGPNVIDVLVHLEPKE
ncbi:MAG: cation transporter [Deltaproteobacteria bacterium]|nr:cation transporter [Deltaproteobacteria bacterium]